MSPYATVVDGTDYPAVMITNNRCTMRASRRGRREVAARRRLPATAAAVRCASTSTPAMGHVTRNQFPMIADIRVPVLAGRRAGLHPEY